MEIYFIRNTTNDKVYIGKTTVGFTIRKSGHLGRLRKGKHINPHLQRAYNQNPDAFTFELFATASNPDDLSRMEIGLIALYQAGESEYGYNMTWGGEGKWGTPLKTHCPRGHEYTPENTYTKKCRPNSRECRICRRSHRTRFAIGPSSTSKRKQCCQGHPSTEANTLITKRGYRTCRLCRNARQSKWRNTHRNKNPNTGIAKGTLHYRYGVRFTECKRGHPYDVGNTYVKPSGERVCRECKRIRDREGRTRKRMARNHTPQG